MHNPIGALCFCVFLDRMTKYDVKNYLEKIYEVPVGAVRTRIQFGEFLHSHRQKNVFYHKKKH